MIKVTCEIGGKKIDIDDQKGIAAATVNAVVDKAINVVTKNLSPEELDHIEIQISGDNLNDLSLNIHGPEETIEKIKDNCD